AGRLFRGHVAGRAEYGSGGRHAVIHVETFDQSEIADLRIALGRQQNVGWFEVAMDDPLLMSIMDGASQLLDQLSRLTRRFRLAPQMLGKTAAGDILHGEERLSILLVKLMDLD